MFSHSVSRPLLAVATAALIQPALTPASEAAIPRTTPQSPPLAPGARRTAVGGLRYGF